MSDKEKIIYCAAILEGEGSFVNKSKYSMYIQCQMTDKDIILRLQEYFGGNVCKATDRNPKWKSVWIWTIYGGKAENVARKILPYMGMRRSTKIKELLSLRDIKAKLNKKADDAAKLYLLGSKSLREIQNETGVNRQTILRHKRKLEM